MKKKTYYLGSAEEIALKHIEEYLGNATIADTVRFAVRDTYDRCFGPGAFAKLKKVTREEKSS